MHPTRGTVLGLPVRVTGSETEPIEIVFAADLAVEVELRDGGEPLVGVTCWLWDESGRHGLPPATTDAAGRALWDRLGPGRFVVKTSHPDLWPTEAAVEARAPGQASPIQVRRRGSVELELHDALGASLPEQTVSIVSLEFGRDVSDWVGAGLVEASTGATRTDPSGHLGIIGLPRGDYTWAAAGGQGVFTVSPGGTEPIRLTVP